MTPRIFSKFAVVGLIFLLAVSVFADTIRLKDGSIIKGKITGFSGGRFTIVIGEGSRQRTLSYTANEVESIEFDAPGSLPGTNTISRNTPTVRVVDNMPPTRESRPANPRVVTTETVADNRPPVPQTRPTPRPTPLPNTSTPRPTTSSTQPIELNVKVLADSTANGWTHSGWVVKKDQRIRITGSGQVSLGNDRSTGPAGREDIEDGDKLMRAVATGALIAVVGDDNNDFIYVGASREFTAQRDGALFLGLNEGNLDDNTGSFDVKIEILP
ncbi:MAG: hypothetical protein IPM21_10030 [Acidobacteria bacterium]|nr:hypothetical protein [Acidobacteriota bacterium]